MKVGELVKVSSYFQDFKDMVGMLILVENTDMCEIGLVLIKNNLYMFSCENLSAITN